MISIWVVAGCLVASALLGYLTLGWWRAVRSSGARVAPWVVVAVVGVLWAAAMGSIWVGAGRPAPVEPVSLGGQWVPGPSLTVTVPAVGDAGAVTSEGLEGLGEMREFLKRIELRHKELADDVKAVRQTLEPVYDEPCVDDDMDADGGADGC